MSPRAGIDPLQHSLSLSRTDTAALSRSVVVPTTRFVQDRHHRHPQTSRRSSARARTVSQPGRSVLKSPITGGNDLTTPTHPLRPSERAARFYIHRAGPAPPRRSDDRRAWPPPPTKSTSPNGLLTSLSGSCRRTPSSPPAARTSDRLCWRSAPAIPFSSSSPPSPSTLLSPSQLPRPASPSSYTEGIQNSQPREHFLCTASRG
jgi:hypothetical protein